MGRVKYNLKYKLRDEVTVSWNTFVRSFSPFKSTRHIYTFETDQQYLCKLLSKELYYGEMKSKDEESNNIIQISKKY